MNYKACLFFLSVCFVAHAQSISNSSSNDVQVKTEEENKYAMVEYEEVLNDDIVWSRVVYEEIDLSEKFNHPLYFPKDGLKDNNRKTLWSIIRESILEKKIATLYNDANPNFNEEMEPDTYLTRIQNTFGPEPVPLRSSDISSYIIKGVWYFDKIQSEMFFKILGLMPRGRDMNNFSNDDPVDLFWIWFDDLRPYIQEDNVVINTNGSIVTSFDKILSNRVFNARIIGTNSVFNNRLINEYVNDPFMQLMESERIKNEILNFELDLWVN